MEKEEGISGQIEAIRRQLTESGAKPLPLVTRRWLRGLALSGHRFRWYLPPTNVAAALLAGDVFVIASEEKLLLLRDGERSDANTVSGRHVEVSPEDYHFWSLMASHKNNPQAVRLERVPTEPTCTECQFSINPCGIHDL